MTSMRLRFWLLTGLNLLAGATVMFLAFDEFSATRGLIDDGILLLLIFTAFVAVPLVSLVVYFLGRNPPLARTLGQRIYGRLSIAFLALCWLAIAAPALFWGVIVITAREPWPLSLAQGPDSERARAGVERLFGADPAQAMSSVYFVSFKLRDASYFVRFDYRDPGVIKQITGGKDLVGVPLAVRSDGRYDVRAYRNRWSWWNPDEINRSDALYVDRPTGDKIAGTLSRKERVGVSRVLWVDEKTRTAYYREIEF